jgi:DNA-directed RNA polymerase subunit RPC12/RpoP
MSKDSDGEPCRFLNLYRCDDCGTEWQDQWSCACDDRCPECDAEIEPFHSYVDDESLLIDVCHACGKTEFRFGEVLDTVVCVTCGNVQ